MGRPLKIAKSATIDSGYNNPEGASYGVVGGNTAISGQQIVARVKIGSNAEANGYILRQKGKSKFLVTDGTNTGICLLSNLANGSLTADTMTITATKADTSTVRLKSITDYWGSDFSGNKYIVSFNGAGAAPAGSLYPIVDVASA